jgi:hypothetical protein
VLATERAESEIAEGRNEMVLEDLLVPKPRAVLNPCFFNGEPVLEEGADGQDARTSFGCFAEFACAVGEVVFVLERVGRDLVLNTRFPLLTVKDIAWCWREVDRLATPCPVVRLVGCFSYRGQ